MNPLHALEFLDARNRPIDGLVPVRHPEKCKSPDERAVVDKALQFEHIDYVYFRRFGSEGGRVKRSSQVAAYVIDNRKRRLSDDELASLHHALWLHAVAPLVYVAWPTRIDILSCARKPDFWVVSGDKPRVRYLAAESIETAADVSDALSRQKLMRCSAHRLADGTFWEDAENQKLSKEDSAAHRMLIQAVVEADRKLEGRKHPVRRRLLVLMILIKYLEDRGVFPHSLFGRFQRGARSVLDVLRQADPPIVSRLLRYFEKKFNGDVFSLGGDAPDLTDAELRPIAALLEGKTLGNQRHFWELFDFRHIPVEVISRLYQRFVTGHGAVYTPPFLAELLLDHVMPLDTLKGDETVLDPACGSGVFLVGAFKRLVEVWRSRNNWKKPTPAVLNRILSRSIHGVEAEPAAVDLTAFSLALAVCDALSPPVIWKSLRFDKLRGRNLREGDFFAPTTTTSQEDHAWPGRFDVIVGNPPFESKLSADARRANDVRPDGEPGLPDRQIAYLFLDRCLRSLAERGCLCLLQPHGLLYNSKTTEFRQHLMKLARLDSVLDFVSVRGLYEGASKETIAWCAINEPANGDDVVHQTFRRTFPVAGGFGFELDHYDWHEIPQAQAGAERFVWRAGLLGGGRLDQIGSRLRRIPSLAEFVDRPGWIYGEGFIVGNRDKDGRFLHGLPLLQAGSLGSDGIDDQKLDVVREIRFQWPRKPEQYEPPLVVIAEHSSIPVGFWDNGPLAFPDKIVGIHAPEGERRRLESLFEFLRSHSRVLQFCCAINGSQALAGRATAILKQDIDLLPVPENPSDIEFAFWEGAIRDDVLEHMVDYVLHGENSRLLVHSADAPAVRQYSDLFVRMLGSLYRELKAAEPVFLKNGLIAQPFYFGRKPDVSWLGKGTEDALRRLVYERTGEALRTVRVVRYYEGNTILIVKPDRLRYWIRSTAIRDADDTLVELREQGW